MNDDDILLDKIVEKLQYESVPGVPAALTAASSLKPRRWIGYTVGACTLAASLIGFLFWNSFAFHKLNPHVSVEEEETLAVTRESDVIVRGGDLVEPLLQLEINLSLIDTKIKTLRSKAALLDAQQLADELLAQH